MKKFKFALQPMLNVRLSLEKQQKADLAKARQHQLDCQQTLARMEQEFDDANENYKHMASVGTDPTNLATYARYFDYMMDVIAEQQEIVHKAAEAVAKCQSQLIKTMQDRKMLEKLRETQMEQYRQYVQAETDKEIGDMVSYRTTINQ